MALNLLRDCKDIKGEEEKKEGCVKHRERSSEVHFLGNDSNLLIVFYVQIMPDDFVMQLHRF
ncbi:hypothetical protein ESCOCP332M_25500 [Escherichia coli]|nr:hypothetical protein A1WQ_02257 [Escherichia coli KTE103]EQY25072.1 hypothetical protein G943_01707 [Escherichia coli UMEA 3212-1]GCL82326.1 short-chain dehydrogenase [Escherichia coli]CAD6008353.1 Uncharacterised protein [Escherichia coli]CAD6182128.1 Putative transposase yncI [Escherichia coli]